MQTTIEPGAHVDKGPRLCIAMVCSDCVIVSADFHVRVFFI